MEQLVTVLDGGPRSGSAANKRCESFQQVVLRALQLPRMYSEVFILSDIQHYKIAETARMLGISPQAVSRRLRRARRMLSSRDG